jgi:hypothetical protein
MQKILYPTVVLCLVFAAPGGSANELSAGSKRDFFRVVSTVNKAVLALNPRVNSDNDTTRATRVATYIAVKAKQHNLDPRILLAILSVESSFDQTAVSDTGDVSIAQINTKVWVRGMRVLLKSSLDVPRLKRDEIYAIGKMCQILSWLKMKHKSSDKWWFARYHSSTHIYKQRYIKQLTAAFKKIQYLGPDLLKGMPPLEKLKFASNNNSLYAPYIRYAQRMGN